ncbi:MAG: hypothetical protein ACOX1U_04505 [Saccharofermentanales bacterium]|jgi:hypothetical protein|nr:hypothetical protein [Clostridiaceae bacterium]
MTSKNYQPHLYMICYPISALVLSQLKPEEFGYRYNYGSANYYAGKLIFAEIDINYRHPYFRIDEVLEKVKAHPDGTPKATKYVSSYRVIEHVELDAVQALYLANADGTSYPLYPQSPENLPDNGGINVYAEITPVHMLTLSKFSIRDFGRWFTAKENPLHVPRILYLQIGLDVDGFLSDFQSNPFLLPPLEGVHPSKLRDAILDLRSREEKFVKGITLNASFTNESYRCIQYGFMMVDANKELFFPMPDLKEIERNNLRFWRGM